MEHGLVRSCGAWSCLEFNFSAILEKKQFTRLAFSVSFTAELLSPHFNGPIQARSVVIFPSTHKNIWSRNLSKLSEKYCVLYFLFEIVVWIQAKNKVSCPYFEQTWCEHNIVLVVDPRACAQQRFSFHSTVIIYKQRARRLSLCCANWSSTLSTLISFSLWMCNIANDERRWSVIVFRSGVFNLFIELKLRSAAHADTGYVKSVFTAT